MNERTMLERAARAAGLDLRWQCDRPHIGDWLSRKWWNPLTDDGDALRLAVKLNISIHRPVDGDSKAHWGTYATPPDQREVPKVYDEADPMAATRLAIVRAAAQLDARGD